MKEIKSVKTSKEVGASTKALKVNGCLALDLVYPKEHLEVELTHTGTPKHHITRSRRDERDINATFDAAQLSAFCVLTRAVSGTAVPDGAARAARSTPFALTA